LIGRDLGFINGCNGLEIEYYITVTIAYYEYIKTTYVQPFRTVLKDSRKAHLTVFPAETSYYDDSMAGWE